LVLMALSRFRLELWKGWWSDCIIQKRGGLVIMNFLLEGQRGAGKMTSPTRAKFHTTYHTILADLWITIT